jgi:hypothetical protein
VTSLFRTIAMERLAPGAFDPVPEGAVWSDLITRAFASLPGGQALLWNVPFALASAGSGARWVWLGPGARHSASVLLDAVATFVLVAHFTLPDPRSADPTDSGSRPSGFVTSPGERVADYVLSYADAGTHRQGVRRRFEINDVLTHWGQLAFLARPHRAERALSFRGPHRVGEWGSNQTAAELPVYWGVDNSSEPSEVTGTYWIYALENPRPGVAITSIELVSAETGHVAVAGITLFEGAGHPLRYGSGQELLLRRSGATAPVPMVSIDLGTIAGRRAVRPLRYEDWATTEAGLGTPIQPTAMEVLEVAAARDAVLSVDGDAVRLAELAPAGRSLVSIGGHILPLAPMDRTIAVSIVDGASGRVVPARVHVETPEGRYLPPHGHRREVNDGWFEDYGADLKLGATQSAYVDGEFLIDLPDDDVLVEVVKGFEFAPLRQRVRLGPGETALELTLARPLDIRAEGWVSADTHVHFISPETARLEAEAEGINVVNLLAAQWGDLYTNVGDFTGAASGASNSSTIVWVGTENRQHMLGHLSMLGIRGHLPGRLSAGGPSESFIGEPVWNSLAAWADEAHDRDGLVVIPHFPTPESEVIADVVLGKVDALEVRDFWWGIDSHAVRAWYRLLNCGFRVPVVGGTDKMSAEMPVGGVRTFAQIGDADLTFATWADAVRGGRTVTSSGPFLDLLVDGQGIGSEVRVGRTGGPVEIDAVARSVFELTALEIVHNGRVVARGDAEPGSHQIRLHERLRVAGGWLAARAWGPGRALHVWRVRVAAHSSPIYITGEPTTRDADDLAYLTAILDGGRAWLGTLAAGNAIEIQRADSTFAAAVAVLGDLRPRAR